MTLTLRIDNYDVMHDGGPSSITLTQSGCCAGRSTSMDWVLPDPAKHISGHHFDVDYSDGAYWLTDVSTNGTFLQGQRYRLEGPHRLLPNDRLIVGHYVIVAEMVGDVRSGSDFGLQQPPTVDQSWDDSDDPWDLGGDPAEPINPLPSLPVDPRHIDDVSREFMPLSTPKPESTPSRQLQQPPASVSQHTVAKPPSQIPMPTPTPSVPAEPPKFQAPPAAMAETDDVGEVFQAFCDGMGISPAADVRVDPVDLARDMGRCVRIATEEMMRMLQDRASVKQFTKGGERTMRSATGNNPLKFLPDVEQTIEALFLVPRDGFMTGPDGFENALKDIRQHQMAVFAALQPSLAELLDGLSPEQIEEKTSGNLLGGSKRAKAWETFVQRWDAKTNAGDNGMLDAFLEAFSRAYAEAAVRGGS